MEQLLLPFKTESREDFLEREVMRLNEQCNKIRKSLHAKNNELYKLCIEQKRRLDVFEEAFCKNNKRDNTLFRNI